MHADVTKLGSSDRLMSVGVRLELKPDDTSQLPLQALDPKPIFEMEGHDPVDRVMRAQDDQI